MKLVNYYVSNFANSSRVGFILNGQVIDVQHAYQKWLQSQNEDASFAKVTHEMPADPNLFFSLGETVLEKAKLAYDYAKDAGITGLDREEVRLGVPIPEPRKIICVGKNYADHAAEMDSDVPEFPVLFSKFSNALIGPDDDIEKSSATEQLDYEVELAVVIGKEATKVRREEAADYILGFTIGNDISARDLQKRTQQWLQGKTLDRTTPIGPWVVTKDEVGDFSNLAIRSYVNGELRQQSNTGKMIFDVPYLLEFITNLITLQPGDIILTGTPDGVGFAMNPPQFLQDGDVVTLEIENIGKMENKVVER